MKLAWGFAWANIAPALLDGVGSIPLEEICELGTLDYVERFEDYLIPEDIRTRMKTPRVMVSDEAWEQVCTGLLSRGVCELVPHSQVYHLDNFPLFNGMFGVSRKSLWKEWKFSD